MPKKLDHQAELRRRVSPRYFEIGDRMLAAVPELAPAVSDYISEWGEGSPGPINLTDEVLVPFALRLLEDPTKGQTVQRVLSFIEDLANDIEPSIRDVAQQLVNSLSDHEDFRRLIEKAGGKAQALLVRSRTIG